MTKPNNPRLRIGFIMDPIERINLDNDTSFVIMLEAQRRGHRLYYFTPDRLEAEDGRPMASMCPVKVRRPSSPRSSHFSLGPAKQSPLESLDLIFNRVDPPYTLDYVTLVQTLALVPPPTMVINRPAGVLLANEKILAMHFPQLMPPTIVTREPERIREFMERVGGKIVLKSLAGFGGEGVLVARKGDTNLAVIIETVTDKGTKQVVAQKFLPVNKCGDKRIILLAGEPMGAMLRWPGRGDHRANLHSGGSAARARITDRDLEICRAVGPLLRREGLYLAGLDIIDGWLTEINVTSPTLIQQINRFEGVKLEERIMDFSQYLAAAARGRKP